MIAQLVEQQESAGSNPVHNLNVIAQLVEQWTDNPSMKLTSSKKGYPESCSGHVWSHASATCFGKCDRLEDQSFEN